MKRNYSLLALCLLVIGFSCAEDSKKNPKSGNNINPDTISSPVNTAVPVTTYVMVDKSPMDMSYFPVDYPQLKMTSGTIPPPVARVIYSRPHLEKRHLFRDLLKYNEPWRLGANESTEIDFYQPVSIQGKKIPPGRYIIYCIPQPDAWTIALNTNIDTWGLHQDTTKDLQRFTIPVATTNPPQEYFTMFFEKTNEGADLVMIWENLLAKLPIKLD